MSNKRINELPTVSSISPTEDYLIVDPTSGGTSKISIENAVTQSNWAKAGASAGAPKIAVNAMTTNAWVVPNLFATSTTCFGTLSVFKTGGKYKTLIAWNTYEISTEKDSSIVNVLWKAERSEGRNVTASGLNKVEAAAGNPNGSRPVASKAEGPIYIFTNGIWIYRGFAANFMYWIVE